MKNVTNVAWTLLAIAILATFVWGSGWCLDEEERQVRAGKKLPGTTTLPLINYEQKLRLQMR